MKLNKSKKKSLVMNDKYTQKPTDRCFMTHTIATIDFYAKSLVFSKEKMMTSNS